MKGTCWMVVSLATFARAMPLTMVKKSSCGDGAFTYDSLEKRVRNRLIDLHLRTP